MGASRRWWRVGLRLTVKNSTARAGRLRRVVAFVVSVVGLVSFVVMGATAAGASCAPPPTIEESMARAELVFVGTAVEVTNSSRWATFAVEDIWKGHLDGDRAEIRGGAREGAGSSVDRKYTIDTRYLVFASAPPTEPALLRLYGDGVRWTDNDCSLTQPYTETLRQARPATARALGSAPPEPAIERPPARLPQSTGTPGDRGPFDQASAWPFAVGVAMVGGVGAVGIRYRLRQRTARRS